MANSTNPRYKSVQTDGSDGTVFVPLANERAKEVTVYNQTGTSLTVRVTGGEEFTIPDDIAWPFGVRENANELAVKRTDETTTQVAVQYLAEEIFY